MSGRGRGRGRGEYYKNKYGGGGRGRGGGHRGNSEDYSNRESSSRSKYSFDGNTDRSYQDLIATLAHIDNKSYPAYHDIESSQGGWVFEHAPRFTLFIGRAQSDPYARPTRCRIVVSAATAQFPRELCRNKIRSSVALADYIHRRFYSECQSMGADQCDQGNGGGWSGPKGGDIQIAPPTQHVVEQSAVMVHQETGDVIAQFTVNLPARGRTILGQKAIDIFQRVVPHFVGKSLVYSAFCKDSLQQHVFSVEDQHWVRSQLSLKGLVAFVPNGAILPRASGADDRPMEDSKDQHVVRFESPESMNVSFELPNSKTTIYGMGIKKGVNLIVGGGFHGKSTLLSAIQLGVYDKIPGDGREFCVCDESSVKIRAEDGRSVTNVDISSFISNLPFGKSTNNFTTLDASGSTSQASNIIEALEVGSNTLLIDEDTCATNFMIRDEKMIELVSPDQEPITPFVKKVQSLYKDKGVSAIIVVGGSGDYFDVADHVIMMNNYQCFNVTKRAKDIAEKWNKLTDSKSSTLPFGNIANRFPRGDVFVPDDKVSVRSSTAISYGRTDIDLSGLEQIVGKSQTQSIALILQMIPKLTKVETTLHQMLIHLERLMDERGLQVIDTDQFHGGLARPRKFEIAGAINRLRIPNSLIQK